jgi:lipopolysaccharide heptosyltransferase II
VTDEAGGLVIRAPNHLGELILALPALSHAAAVENEAGRRLRVQLVAGLEPILEMAGLEVELLPLRDRRDVRAGARQIRESGVRRGILLTPSASSALMFRLGGLRSRRGTAGGWRTWMLTDPVPRGPLLETHRVHEFLALVGVEADGDPPAPVLRPPDGVNRPRAAGETRVVALFPGANAESRRWPAGRFSALAQRLAGAGRRVLVLGGPGEQELTAVVASAGAAFGECEDLGGRTDLAALAAVLARCDALVTNDTGPMHFAAALGAPVVALEGPADVGQTRPLGPRVRLIGRFELPCVPCVRNRCPRTGPGTELAEAQNECMWLISVDEVERAVHELLEGSGSGD